MARAALSLFLLFPKALARGPSCLDGSGHEVDFWYIFCHPDGLEYSYLDSKKSTLHTPSGTLDSRTSPLSRTLEQAYKGDVAYAMWNDEHPDGKKVPAPHAHAKGVVAFKSAGGFWLTHSLPRFPETVRKGYPSSWDAAAQKYGQSYLCISVDTDALRKVGDAMATNWPSVYDSAVPDFADSAVPNFADWAGGKHQKHQKTADSVVQTISSRGGTDFQVFSKSSKFGKDLYSELVAPKLRSKMITETWQNGRGNLPSACKGHKHVKFSVMNSDGVSMGGAEWKDHQDHSKWGVTESGSVLCVGDINRQSGQFTRGGGTICLHDSAIAKQLRRAVTSYQDCGGAEVVLV